MGCEGRGIKDDCQVGWGGRGVSLERDRWWHWLWVGEPGDVVRWGIKESEVQRHRSGGQ